MREGWEVKECKTWEDFIEEVRSGDGKPLDPIYRGQADPKWCLVAPSVRGVQWHNEMEKKAHRETRGPNIPAMSANRFRRLATGLPGVDVRDLEEIDLLALGRHNGLNSDLLDWTTSPYVAAFFAFYSALDQANEGRLLNGTLGQFSMRLETHPVAVWRLAPSRDTFRDGELERHTTLSAQNYWQKAQAGLFTRLLHPDFVDLIEYLGSRKLLSTLKQIVIPGTEATKALHDLALMNIDFASLFPDLHGAALQANIDQVWRSLGTFTSLQKHSRT